MNNDTNIKSMPNINTSMSFDVDSQALISAISSAISNGFENLNSLQVDAVAQIEENTENIETNTQNITNMSSAMGDITYKKLVNVFYGSPKTLTVSNHFRGKISLLDSSLSGCGEYLIFSTGSGNTDTKTIVAQSRTTISNSVNTFILDNTASGQVLLIVESFQGTFTIS